MPTTKSQEDENIYINCDPVDTIGNEVDNDETEESTSGTGSTFDTISNDLNSGKILDNLGLQFTIAITAFAIIYGIGNYVFKTIPREMLEKRINSL
jgi:hypothetical protein